MLKNLSPNEGDNLSLQAVDYLHKDSLFNTLKTEMDRVATIKIFQKSGSLEDIYWGKIMLYTNNLWAEKIKALANKIDAQRIGRE